MITATLTAMKVTVLMIAGCTGTDIESDDVGDCPTSSYVETWTGINSQEECDQYIRSKGFEPNDYLPGWPSYVVSCKPKSSTTL